MVTGSNRGGGREGKANGRKPSFCTAGPRVLFTDVVDHKVTGETKSTSGHNVTSPPDALTAANYQGGQRTTFGCPGK